MVNMQYYPPLKRHKFTSRGQGQRKRKHYTSSAAVPTYTCACSAHIANETKRGFERRIFKTSELILHPAVSLVKAKGERKKKEVLLKKYSPRFLSSLPPFLATSDNCHSASIQKREEPPYGISRKKKKPYYRDGPISFLYHSVALTQGLHTRNKVICLRQ